MVRLSSLAIRRHIRRRTTTRRRRRQRIIRSSMIDDVPEEIMELILSKCPVKSVVRFKSVSRSWQSIISSRRFSRIHHIHWSNENENNKKLLLWAWGCTLGKQIYSIRLEEDGLICQIESMLPYPSPVFDTLCCSCDGLILLRQIGNNQHYMLWNPSIRKHIIIMGPPSTAARLHFIHFYYDPTTDDYRIVFSNETSYTVYSCNKGNWSEIQYFHCIPCFKPTAGVYVDGCLYGLVINDEIACFDTRDGNLHKFRQPNDAEWHDSTLKVVSGSLYCDGFLKDGNPQRWAMEEHGSFKKWVREKKKKKSNKSGLWKLINMEKEEVTKLKFTSPNFCLEMETKWVHLYKFCRYSDNLHMPCPITRN